MPIIEWGNWQAAQEAITNGNNALSGMKPPAAESALKFTKVTLKDGSTVYAANTVNAPPQTNWQLNFDTNSMEAYYEYIGEGGKTSATGAATTGTNVKNSVNLAMTEKAGGLASVGALLSVNLPTAAAAIAPVAGVAIGAGLYSLNPDLWDKISRALLPFCYEGTELLPVVADENGVTYFPNEAVDAVKKELSDISYQGASIAPEVNPHIVNKNYNYAELLNPYPFQFAVTNSIRVNYSDRIEIWRGTSPFRVVGGKDEAFSSPNAVIFASDVEQTIIRIVESTGVQKYPSINLSGSGSGGFYYSSFAGEVLDIPIVAIGKNNYPGWTYHDIAAMMQFGYSTYFPEGISQWTGVQYPLNPEGIGVVTRISPDSQLVTTAPYYPVTMPVGDPGVSPSPNEVPIPGANPEVAPAVDPWLTPKPDKKTYPEGQPESEPAPIENPVPDNNPDLDPDANPSEAIETKPKEDPVQSTKPTDNGTTPSPIIPIIPVLPSAATGLLHVYNPTQNQLDSFGSWLWTTFSGDLIDTVSKLFNDPMDAVIGLHELYATPAVSGSSTIRAGFLDSKVSSNLVGSRYTEINCGSIVVQEYYQNYLDYSPYTKCYIYLPFVGIAPVLADDIIGNAVNVTYHVDSYTGCCIAVVTVAREGYSSTIYQFEGNCAVEIPITSGYQSTLMGALIGVGATALTGNPHAGIAAANMGRASLGKNDVSHSGSFGSSYGAMGAKVPYIIVKRPTQKSVVNYNQDYGFPAHKRVTIGVCSGYLRAREVHVISPTATDDEKARIEELLKEGVFVK